MRYTRQQHLHSSLALFPASQRERETETATKTSLTGLNDAKTQKKSEKFTNLDRQRKEGMESERCAAKVVRREGKEGTARERQEDIEHKLCQSYREDSYRQVLDHRSINSVSPR